MRLLVTSFNYQERNQDCNFPTNEQHSELNNIAYLFPQINEIFYYWSNYSKIKHFNCMGAKL